MIRWERGGGQDEPPPFLRPRLPHLPRLLPHPRLHPWAHPLWVGLFPCPPKRRTRHWRDYSHRQRIWKQESARSADQRLVGRRNRLWRNLYILRRYGRAGRHTKQMLISRIVEVQGREETRLKRGGSGRDGRGHLMGISRITAKLCFYLFIYISF